MANKKRKDPLLRLRRGQLELLDDNWRKPAPVKRQRRFPRKTPAKQVFADSRSRTATQIALLEIARHEKTIARDQYFLELVDKYPDLANAPAMKRKLREAQYLDQLSEWRDDFYDARRELPDFMIRMRHLNGKRTP